MKMSLRATLRFEGSATQWPAVMIVLRLAEVTAVAEHS
jgi:hypothetical protein